jgi:hypothetical protein
MPLGMLLFGAPSSAAAQDAERALSPPVWVTGSDGGRFRVRFDPGHRLLLGMGAHSRITESAATAAPWVEVGLLLRSARPPPDWDVHWKRNHEFLHFRLQPGAAPGQMQVSGPLYRGLFLRQSRVGSLTLPVSPPIALPLPFDIGIMTEVGRIAGPLWPDAGGAPASVGVVHGEVLADFCRSRQPGRWLTVGAGGRYEIGLSRDQAGTLLPDHRVSPMTALSLAGHAERADGLLAGGLRVEGSHRWSSARRWERAFRLDGDVEVTPIAINDRPVSLFTAFTAAVAPHLPQPELRLTVGLRIAEPLR